MAKKRVIFTLLYNNGGFMLSRNFRLQRAGDVNWLLKNYNFSSVSTCIDELLIVDVSRGQNDRSEFLSAVRRVIDSCFVPVALGGRILDFETARLFIASGADKVVMNSVFDSDPAVPRKIADTFGVQCLIGGIDVRRIMDDQFEAVSGQGSHPLEITPASRVQAMLDAGAGEILVQSIDRDGTGFGFDFGALECVDAPLSAPVILCGGCGKSEHMREALVRDDVDAVATANLFNFIGNGLQTARAELLAQSLDLAHWDVAEIQALRAILSRD